jgi:hypothetical protein
MKLNTWSVRYACIERILCRTCNFTFPSTENGYMRHQFLKYGTFNLFSIFLLLGLKILTVSEIGKRFQPNIRIIDVFREQPTSKWLTTECSGLSRLLAFKLALTASTRCRRQITAHICRLQVLGRVAVRLVCSIDWWGKTKSMTACTSSVVSAETTQTFGGEKKTFLKTHNIFIVKISHLLDSS